MAQSIVVRWPLTGGSAWRLWACPAQNDGATFSVRYGPPHTGHGAPLGGRGLPPLAVDLILLSRNDEQQQKLRTLRCHLPRGGNCQERPLLCIRLPTVNPPFFSGQYSAFRSHMFANHSQLLSFRVFAFSGKICYLRT
jgi:hypothetical protein